jgi:hypothetical protein
LANCVEGIEGGLHIPQGNLRQPHFYHFSLSGKCHKIVKKKSNNNNKREKKEEEGMMPMPMGDQPVATTVGKGQEI